MRVYLPTFDKAEHLGEGYRSEYGLDWERAQQKFKQPMYQSPWRIYENNSYMYNGDGEGKPAVRDNFSHRATGSIVLAKEAPVLYCGEKKVIKKHVFPQHRSRFFYSSDRRFSWRPVGTLLLDHQYGTAQVLENGFFLPYNGAQPIIRSDSRFVVYWVTRKLLALHKERADHVRSVADAIIDLTPDPNIFREWDREVTPAIFKEMKRDFSRGEFGQWTSAMYYRAVKVINAEEPTFLYAMSPRSVTEKLYTRPVRLSSPPVVQRWRS